MANKKRGVRSKKMWKRVQGEEDSKKMWNRVIRVKNLQSYRVFKRVIIKLLSWTRCHRIGNLSAKFTTLKAKRFTTIKIITSTCKSGEMWSTNSTSNNNSYDGGTCGYMGVLGWVKKRIKIGWKYGLNH